MIGAVARHRPTDGHDRHQNQGRGDADDPEPHRHHQQQRHQQEAVGQAQLGEDGVAGGTDQPQKGDPLGQTRRFAHDRQMAALHG
ncbi:hypothetical protein D3C86_1636500 [compost metagenome]